MEFLLKYHIFTVALIQKQILKSIYEHKFSTKKKKQSFWPRSSQPRTRLLSIPHIRLETFGHHSFSGFSIWNGPPPSFHTAESLYTFQSRLKTYLFRKQLLWRLSCCPFPYSPISVFIHGFVLLTDACSLIYVVLNSTRLWWWPHVAFPHCLWTCKEHQAHLCVGEMHYTNSMIIVIKWKNSSFLLNLMVGTHSKLHLCDIKHNRLKYQTDSFNTFRTWGIFING